MPMTADMAQILAAFSAGQIQDALTLFDLLARRGLTVEDLRRHRAEAAAAAARDVRARERRLAAFRERARRCPACGNPMGLHAVNTGPRDQVGGGYRSQWICRAPGCLETEFNRQSVAEILSGMGLAPPARPKKGCCNGKA
jgi:hypothetical protein